MRGSVNRREENIDAVLTNEYLMEAAYCPDTEIREMPQTAR